MKLPGFETQEIKEILISTIALGFIFAYPNIDLMIIALYIFVLGISFVPHELAHKFMAMKYGAYARYEMWKQGLAFALLLAVITGGGFVFAAPGAVVIYTQFMSKRGYHEIYITEKKNAYISLVGPGMNVLVALLFFLASPLVSGEFLGLIVAMVIHVNLFLALFNMIPMHPLDGSKIFAWDKKVWLAMFALVFVLWQII